MKKILFVCTGNTCRSPMAEGLFNMAAESAGIKTRAASCGLSVSTQQHASANAVEAASRLGADITDHRPRQLSAAALEGVEAIYCMTRQHADVLERLGLEIPVTTLSGRDIADPYGGDIEDYMYAARQIDTAVRALVEQFEDEA